MLLAVVLSVFGLVVLAVGADALVEGAARVARSLDVPPFVVGAVVIGAGTGAPELLVSSLAAAQGSLDLAVGNIIGSNAANLTLVLGLTGLVARPVVDERVVRRAAPGAVLAMAAFAVTLVGGLTRIEALLLLVALGLATLGILRRPAADAGAPDPLGEEVRELTGPAGRRPATADLARTVGGLAGTLVGAQLLVMGAEDVADRLGVAEGVVGVLLVALGTSLPELVTALQSARRHQTDLVIGNVLGSNVFNSLAVGGTAGLLGPGPVDPALSGAPAVVMVGTGLLAWAALAVGRRLTRPESALLVGAYVITAAVVV